MTNEPPLLSCEVIQKLLSSMESSGKLAWTRELREHVEHCKTCWNSLVLIRWRMAADSKDLLELKEFVGSDFQWGVDSSWLLVRDWQSADRYNTEQVRAFYRDTKWYLYNLTLWEASGQRPKYVNSALSLLERYHIKSVLDFGAGIGTDSLKFHQLSLTVVAADFENDASRFLRWRAAKRGYSITFLNVDEMNLKACAVDMVWALDVVEHLPRPVEELSPLLKNSRIFVYDSEHVGLSEGRHPFHFQHNPKSLELAWKELGFFRDEKGSTETGLEVFVRSECSF